MTPNQRRHCLRLFRQGGVIAYPTEAVYGLGCDPLNPEAAYRLLDLKQRSIDKGLILVASSNSQLAPYVEQSFLFSPQVQDSWPGPVTWVIPAYAHVPYWVRGAHDSVAVRISAHPLVRELCELFNSALISTSANISHRPAAKSALQVHGQFSNQIDYVIAGDLGGQMRPSRIFDARTGQTLRQ